MIGGARDLSLALPIATRCEVTEIDVDLRRGTMTRSLRSSTNGGSAVRGRLDDQRRKAFDTGS